jgi:hypothetical protein
MKTDWAAISRDIRILTHTARPKAAPATEAERLAAKAVEHIEVQERVRRQTIVSGKWVFNE